jgi:polar amino acid transport system substrate-binding protein
MAKKAIELQTFAKQTDVTTAVVNGKAAVFYADSPVAGYAIEQTDGALAPLGADEGVTEGRHHRQEGRQADG